MSTLKHMLIDAQTACSPFRVCVRKRFAFVNLDACMGSQLVTMHVLRQLQVRSASVRQH